MPAREQITRGSLQVSSANGRFAWLVIVLASLGVASVFLATAVIDFTRSSVVTTIETTTASLQVRIVSMNLLPSHLAAF